MNRPDRTAALARLESLVGAWRLDLTLPGEPPGVLGGGRCVFEWLEGGQFLVQREEGPASVPSSLAVIACGPGDGAYTQHYFDSRGVARLYAMTLDDGVWTLSRTAPDFSTATLLAALQGHVQRRRQHDPRRVGEVVRWHDLGTRPRPDLHARQLNAPTAIMQHDAAQPARGDAGDAGCHDGAAAAR